MYFFALSQAPPALPSRSAPRTPAIVAPRIKAATASATARGLSSVPAKRKPSPTAIGTEAATRAGVIADPSAARLPSSTQASRSGAACPTRGLFGAELDREARGCGGVHPPLLAPSDDGALICRRA